MEAKDQKVRSIAQKQRDTLRGVQQLPVGPEDLPEKSVPDDYQDPAEDVPREESQGAQKLNRENLSQLSGSQKQPPSNQSKSKKGGRNQQRPAWAVTPKMEEEQKEKEVEDLIEFAFDLDYEKYMEDYEVRQALAIIKDRVDEIKKDDEWKKNIADEWNKAAAEEEAEGAVGEARSQA